MKLGSFKRISKQDFDPEIQPTVEQLAFPINDGFTSIYDVFNKKVSLADNVACLVKDVLISVDSTGVPLENTTIALGVSDRVIGVEVLKLDNLTNVDSYPTGAPFVTWAQSKNSLIIKHVTGLISKNSYSLRIVAYT
jgi:hypothetical protein